MPIVDELRGEGVAPVGADDPSGTGLVPGQIGDLGVEQGAVVQPVLLPDALAVLEDLRGVGVLLGGHVPGLFEQRHVHEGRGVALGTRVAVPVPGAAEVAALLDDADVVDAGLHEAGRGHEAGEAPADEGDRDVVVQRFALGRAGRTGRRGSGPTGPGAAGTGRCRRGGGACRARRRTARGEPPCRSRGWPAARCRRSMASVGGSPSASSGRHDRNLTRGSSPCRRRQAPPAWPALAQPAAGEDGGDSAGRVHPTSSITARAATTASTIDSTVAPLG